MVGASLNSSGKFDINKKFTKIYWNNFTMSPSTIDPTSNSPLAHHSSLAYQTQELAFPITLSAWNSKRKTDWQFLFFFFMLLTFVSYVCAFFIIIKNITRYNKQNREKLQNWNKHVTGLDWLNLLLKKGAIKAFGCP